MKKLAILFLCYLPCTMMAQNFYFSARVGLSNYQGDLQAKQLTLSGAKFLGSFGARYDLAEHITARTYFSMTALQGDDKKGTATMRMRNLNFKSKLLEWELGAQYNIFSLNDKWWTPYVYAGVGIFHYKPYTTAPDGKKTYLQPLGTEGQGLAGGPKPYKLTQFCIPLGGGVDYALNEDIRVGVELGYRKLFTDYLDDVSGEYADEAALLAARGQTAVDLAYRGDEVGAGPYPPAKTQRGSKQTDGWYYMSLTVTVRSFIDQYKRIAGLPAYRKDKKVGCPSTRF
jgi:hypothetical protein